MEIKIDKTPIAVIKINLESFLNDFKLNFDLEYAYNRNAKLDHITIVNENDMKRYVFLNTDWSNFFILYKETNMQELVLHVYKCIVEGFSTYKYNIVDPSEGVITLKETNNKEQDAQIYFLVYPIFNPKFEKHVEYMLCQQLVEWGEKPDWSQVVSLDGD